MNPTKAVNSNSLEVESQLNDILSGIGCRVIPFDQAPKQAVSKFTIQYPDGTIDEREFNSKRAVRWALIEDDKLFNHCRDVLYALKEGHWSEADENDWLHDNIENEAIELGYLILEVKS